MNSQNKCPVCETPRLSLSKVCSCCGHVFTDDEPTPMSKTIDELDGILYELKKLPSPGVGIMMSKALVYILLILSILSVGMAIISEAGIFWILFAVFFIWWIRVFKKSSKNALQYDILKKSFTELKEKFEVKRRSAMRDYDKIDSVTRVIDDITINIDEVEAKWKSKERFCNMVWMAVVGVLICISVLSVASLKSFVDSKPQSQEPTSSQRIAEYLALPEEEKSNPDLVVRLVRFIVEEGSFDKAENFFLTNVMGNMGDFECAKIIVSAYLEKGDKEKARSFVDRCTEMRYKSDMKKLDNMVKL